VNINVFPTTHVSQPSRILITKYGFNNAKL